jgi:hypothetical protein
MLPGGQSSQDAKAPDLTDLEANRAELLIPGQMQAPLRALENIAGRTDTQIEQRRLQALGTLQQGAVGIRRSALGTEFIGREFGGMVGQASREAMGIRRGFLNQFSAGGGFGGGALRHAGAQLDIGRLGVLAGAQNTIAQTIAQDRGRVAAQLATTGRDIAEVQNQLPGQARAAFLDKKIQMIGAMKISQDQKEAAQYAASKSASAQKKAGLLGLAGSVIGGLLGAI